MCGVLLKLGLLHIVLESLDLIEPFYFSWATLNLALEVQG